MDHEKWFEEALSHIDKEIKTGQVFEVKELFTGNKWNQLQRGEKQSFGRYFSSKVKDGALTSVSLQGESKSRHNMYVKV
ncbi:MAG: single-stranded DNA-binding protein [Roseburia sp.]|nr:single-stranded DNA-binding protein [Roseburia sp.]